ncbi:MAG: YqiA/YcfP family alpha/beta fold hydrolase [Bacteroidales bacterium]|nr:YqiA/YcfP family alpha/beta fold hydrolase [Bacteroidales bacterium]
MKKLLYIHGYNGSAEGSSCQLFRKYMPKDEWQVIGMDYDQNDCAVALQQIRQTIDREGIDLVVGSSLGGFLTLLTTGIKRLVINPCYIPSAELPKLGPHNGLPAPSPQMIASYAAFEPQLKQFSTEETNLITGYFAEDDELLGDRYEGDFCDDIHGYNVIPGGHHVSEEAVKMITFQFTPEYLYLKAAHKASFKNEESIRQSKICACFHCLEKFAPSEVAFMEEYDGQQTAWCPKCGIDAVLGDASGYPITDEFLKKMHNLWF